jgi:hypothetical protein
MGIVDPIRLLVLITGSLARSQSRRYETDMVKAC